MGSEEAILGLLQENSQGASISDISEKTRHTRATVAKYLELMKVKGDVDYRTVGKAKLWVLLNDRKKILVADDNERIRRLVKVILGKDNYDFLEAENGEETLERISEEMPDLLILDLMMPKVDGVEVCKQLKKNALTRKIPIIMLTAKAEMTDKVIGVKVGADDYLTKPFEPRELRARVKTFLEKEKGERNPKTNLQTIDSAFSELKNTDSAIHYLFFKDLDSYKKIYGFSKTNEVIRLTSQIITHCLERLSKESSVCHDDQENFIIVAEENEVSELLKEIKDEFESTIPFFYGADYDNFSLQEKVIIKMDAKGREEKIPLIELIQKSLEKDFTNLEEIKNSLKVLRGS